MTETTDTIDSNCSCALRVIEELNSILIALRMLIKTCENHRLHRQAHALELSLELMLRRRNYILNIYSISAGSGSLYGEFPCENCYITYPSVFVMSWLDYILKSAVSVNVNGYEKIDCEPPTDHLCNSSCRLKFGASARADHRPEGALYPMGAPFTAGPSDRPPAVSQQLSEFDEVGYVRNTLSLVLKSLESEYANTKTSVEVELLECILKLLECRRHFGFDMDCVRDIQVEMYSTQLSNCLQSYDSRVLVETFDRSIFGQQTKSE